MCPYPHEQKGTKRVEVTGKDDKRQLTALFACSMSGDFLPIQLVYQDPTNPVGVSG